MQQVRLPDDADIAVLGAGVAGLTAAKCLLDEGLEPTVYERDSALGGIWRYDDRLTDGSSPAYRSLRTNTSKQMTAFSDFPFPADAPDFPSHADVLAYLNSYADRFDVRERIRFDTGLDTVELTDDGRWRVTLGSGETTYQESFDAVLVCTGHFQEPKVPSVPGIGEFSGDVRHSSDYKRPEEYAGQRVVVVGAGSSAADIAAELSDVTAETLLSLRGGAWFLPHYIRGRPWDHYQSRLSLALPRRVRERIFRRLLFAEYERMGIDFESHPLNVGEREFDFRKARFTPSTALLHRAAVGNIAVVPGIDRFAEHGVAFTNGVRTAVDSVILATGYRWSLPFLERPLVGPIDRGPRLYNHVFQPDHPTLAFVGMCAINGATPPVAEMQSRWVARVLTGALSLPTADEMHDAIESRLRTTERLGIDPMRVQATEYTDEIAEIIGVRPRLSDHFGLIRPLLIGPMVPAQFRLDGPGRWERAESVIRTGN